MMASHRMLLWNISTDFDENDVDFDSGSDRMVLYCIIKLITNQIKY